MTEQSHENLDAFPRLKREAATVAKMISMYCRDNHRHPENCPECQKLTEYALNRLIKCPFGEGKTACSKCPVHCYKPELREQIRLVMRYAGPRMTTRHPVMAIQHLMDRQRKKPLE